MATRQEYADLSKYVTYSPEGCKTSMKRDYSDKWELVPIEGREFYENFLNGFKGGLFHNKETDEYVVAFNQSNDAMDQISNFQILRGELPTQYHTAISFFNKVQNNLPKGAKVSCTGHSLGGALAELVAAKTGCQAYTYNAPGIKSLLEQAGINPAQDFSNITNIGINNDLIFDFGAHIGQTYHTASVFENDTHGTDSIWNILRNDMNLTKGEPQSFAKTIGDNTRREFAQKSYEAVKTFSLCLTQIINKKNTLPSGEIIPIILPFR